MANNPQTQIDRIKTNVTNALAAIAAKGVTVGSDANSDDLKPLIESITQGVFLPELTNPAAASDIYTGKEALDGSGAKLTGTNPYNAANVDPAVTSALSAIAEKGVDTSGADLFDLASLIAAIEAGGGSVNMFTFTPAATGVVTLDVEVPTTTYAIFWCRTDVVDGKLGEADKGQSVGGVSVCKGGIRDGGNQYLATVYNTSAYSTSYDVNTYSGAVNALTSSSTNCYGGPIVVWSGMKKLGYPLTFYANSEGAKGLRVGATYTVIIL